MITVNSLCTFCLTSRFKIVKNNANVNNSEINLASTNDEKIITTASYSIWFTWILNNKKYHKEIFTTIVLSQIGYTKFKQYTNKKMMTTTKT